MSTETQILPDPTITTEEMAYYGYPSVTMLPLNINAAKDLWETANVPVYRLYEDGTEGMVESIEEFETHAAVGGIFGIEVDDWSRVLERRGLKEREAASISVNADISEDQIHKAMQCLVDNGIEEDEACTVLQALGYILLNTELFPEDT